MDIISAYREAGTYRGAAAISGTTPKTVKRVIARHEAVRAENPVHGSDQQSCSSGCPAVMITDHVPALRLPSDHAGGLLVAAVPASGDVEDRRDLDLAPPARGPAATSAAPPELELGGPGSARDSAQ